MVCATMIEVHHDSPYYVKYVWDLTSGDQPWFQSWVGEPMLRTVRTNAEWCFWPY